MKESNAADRRTTRVIVANSFTNAGGSQQAALRLARRLRTKGHDAEAWFIYRKGALFASPDAAGVPVKVLFDKAHLSILDYLRLPFRLYRELRRFGPKAVVTFLPFASAAVLPVALMSGVRRRIASQRVPGDTYSPALRLVDRILGTMGVYTDIVCVSDAVRESFSIYPESYKQRLCVIHNGIEWSGTTLHAAAARKRFGMGDAGLNIVGIGRLSEQKNFGIAIEAVANTPGTRLTIAGDGPDRAELEQRARRLGVSDRVAFLGNQPADSITDLLAACDAFILPSLFEGQSNALLEAMHAGLPVVTSDIPMQRETLMMDDGSFAGLLLPLDSPLAWQQALSRLRDDIGLRHDLGTKAYRLVNDRFSLTRMVDKFEALIQMDSDTPRQPGMPLAGSPRQASG